MMEKQAPRRNGHDSINDSSDTDRDPFETIADEFAQKRRKGESVSIEQYVQQYPQFADEIRELFPSVIAMERLRTAKRAKQTFTHVKAPDELGDFRIIGEIARGGMGVVYEAEQVTLDRRVAVKVLPKHILSSERDIRRFEREAQTAAQLHHTNIVPVFGVGEQDGLHYIVMQLIHGVGLDEILDELKRTLSDSVQCWNSLNLDESRSTYVKRSACGLLQNPIHDATTNVRQCGNSTANIKRTPDDESPTSASFSCKEQERKPSQRLTKEATSQIAAGYYDNIAHIGLQAAQALAYAHQHGTLHRDIKPGNLLLDNEGIVWIADFGLAKAIENNDVTWTGDIVGTLAYLAPERLEGKATARSDIYSLGLTLYEMLTFERAFDGGDRVELMHRVANERLCSLRKLNPGIPRDLETIVLKATASSPADRYESATELAEDLERFLGDRPIHARRFSRVERMYRWCRRNRAIAAIAATAALLIVSITTAGYFRETSQRRRAEATSGLAVSALDEIYGQFAPRQFHAPEETTLDETDDALGPVELPLSNDVALLLENLLRFYDDLAKQADDQSLVIKSISANRRVGDIRRRLGQFEEARRTYEQTIERVESLPTNPMDSRQVRLEYARVQNGLGLVLREQRAFDDVRAAHKKALDALIPNSGSNEEEFERAHTLYLTYLARHRHHGKHHLPKEDSCDQASIEHAISVLQNLRTSHPAAPDYKFLLARCFLALDSECKADGSLNQSQSQAIEMLEELVETSPEVADYRYELGDAYRSIEWRQHWGARRRDQRQSKELAISESRLRRALAVTVPLERKHPNIPQYCLLRKRLHHILALVLTDANQLEEAEDAFTEAVRRQQLIVHQSRDPHSHEMWLLTLQLSHAQVLRELDQHIRAKEYLESIVGSLEALSERPEIRKSRFDRRKTKETLGRAYVTLANVLSQMGEKADAESYLRKAEGPQT